MNIKFNLRAVTASEFGVGREKDGDAEFGLVPVGAGVKSALLSMAQATLDKLESADDEPVPYEPSEKHGGSEYLVVPAGGMRDAEVRKIHDAVNLDFDHTGLSDPESIICYFARFTDNENQHLTAIKRATHFKGVLKSKLIWFADDTLEIVEDDVFKLDNDFDMLLDSDYTHILRPNSFEFLGRLKLEILNAVPDNIDAIAADLPFVDLSGIEEYAKIRLRAARYLASIRSQSLQGMDRDALITLCNSTGVSVKSVTGKFKINAGHEMGFLEVLDRRRYQLKLVHNQPERFRASSRVRI